MNQLHTIKSYKKLSQRRVGFMFIVAVSLLFLLMLGISMGAADIKLSEVLSFLLHPSGTQYSRIILQIRLPRVLTAALAGMALSVSGASMQSLLRNSLASPVSLGISHAAAFGAAFAIVILGVGSSISNPSVKGLAFMPYIVTISAFVFSLISTGLILLISKYKDARTETIVLAGIICGSFFTAGTSVLQYFADDMQLSAIVFWMFGDLGKADWNDFFILLLIILPVMIYFMKNRWNFNAMNAGDETAASLGVDVNKTRIRGMVIASLASATAVSLFGVISFIGLVVPHIVRRFMGSDERYLIPASALFGAMFLLLSDIAARNLFSPIIIPVGIFTSFIGAPLFLYLLLKRVNNY